MKFKVSAHEARFHTTGSTSTLYRLIKTNLMSWTYSGYRLHTLFQYSLATTRLLDLQDLLDIEVPELEE